jgi:type IV fimbrial biogenesis protein FimT
MNGLISPDLASRGGPPLRDPIIHRPAQAGFNLIELMVVVAIVAILAAIAAPSFRDMMRSNRLSAAASALQVSLSLARSEAVKRGSDARVTIAANTAAGAWTQGWTVFVDKTADANESLGPTADVAGVDAVTRLEVVAPLSGPLDTGSSDGLTYFTFNGQGRPVTTTGAAANRSFWFFDGDSERYCVVLSTSGRVRNTRVASGVACPAN